MSENNSSNQQALLFSILMKEQVLDCGQFYHINWLVVSYVNAMPIQLMSIGLKTDIDFKQKIPDTEQKRNQTLIVNSNLLLIFGWLLLLD